MKNLLALIIAVILMACMVGCGNANNDITNNTVAPQSSSVVEDTEDAPETESIEEEEEEETDSEVNWEEFLSEYEAIIDDYIDVYNKYKDNPTDLTILNDYTELSTKITEWAQKAENMEDELSSNPEALKEYTETLSRVTAKLTSLS